MLLHAAPNTVQNSTSLTCRKGMIRAGEIRLQHYLIPGIFVQIAILHAIFRRNSGAKRFAHVLGHVLHTLQGLLPGQSSTRQTAENHKHVQQFHVRSKSAVQKNREKTQTSTKTLRNADF